MRQIVPNVYGVFTRMGYVNFYVIANGDSLTVIDIALGTSDVDRLARDLGPHGWTLDNVRRILITHAHPDHIGGLAELQRRTNAHTAVHRLDAPFIRGEAICPAAVAGDLSGIPRMMLGMIQRNASSPHPARVDRDLQDGDTLDDAFPGLKLVFLPGHSPGHSGYWLEEEGLLIGGDVMMHVMGLRMPLRAASPDWRAVRESIRRVADMNLKVLCLGHGKVITENTAERIRAFADRIAK